MILQSEKNHLSWQSELYTRSENGKMNKALIKKCVFPPKERSNNVLLWFHPRKKVA